MATQTSKTLPAISARTFGMYRNAVNAGDVFSEADDGCGVELTFADGSPSIVITSYNLRGDVRFQALAHGLKQKLVDAAAISRNPDTGRAASVADKAAAVREVYERLVRGEWNKARGEGSGSGGLLYRALVRLYSATKTAEEVRAWLDERSDAEQAALRKNSKVAAMIETIRAESAKAEGIDSAALLAGLGDL